MTAGGAALTWLAMTTGCTASHDQSDTKAPLTPPSITAVPSVTGDAVRTLPLRAFAGSDNDMATVTRAEGLLTQQCMRQLGFATWQPAPPAKLDQAWTTGLKIGIVDQQQATTYGYHAPVDPAAIAARRNSTSANPQQRAELAALSGGDAGNGSTAKPPAGGQIPQGGCEGEARRAMTAAAPKYDVDLYGRIAEQANQATESDQRIADALGAWSACMKRAGQSYRTPWDASEQSWADTPTQSEIALATADVACKTETKLPGTWFAVLSGYQQQLIERNRPGLQAMRAARDAELRKANEVLASGR